MTVDKISNTNHFQQLLKSALHMLLRKVYSQ